MTKAITTSFTPSQRLSAAIPGVIFAAIGMGALTGCDAGDPLAPPVIRLGEDECVVCRMIISDDRYAAAVVMLDERDRHQRHGFDDIGCLFEYEAANPDTRILARYVKDRATRQWLDAEAAELVHSRELHTPMAFGVAATSSLDTAREIHNEFGGDFIRLNEARRRFLSGTLHVSSLDGSLTTPVILESEKTLRLSDGRELHLILLTPQMLPPGKREFELVVHGPLGDSQLRIEPDMPSMGHGSPGNEHPAQVHDDRYRGLVNFTMAGPWLVHVFITADGMEIGRTSFAFEVMR